MICKSGLAHAFEEFKRECEKEGNAGLPIQVNSIACQMDDWIDIDRLSPDTAYARIVRNEPFLVDPISQTGIDVRTALEEFWQRGQEFSAFLTARMLEANEQPAGE